MTIAELFVKLGISGAAEAEASLKKLSGAVSQLKTAFVALGVARLGEKMLSWVEHAAEAGNRTLNLSKQIGVSTDAIQEWSYIAKQSGSSTQEFTTAVGQLERNMRLFAQGKASKEVSRTFAEFGITQARVAQDMKGPNGLSDTVLGLADSAKAMGNSVERSSGIQILAGRRAKGFAADLAQGSDKLRELAAEARKRGMVLSEDELKSLKKTDNAIKQLGARWESLKERVIAKIGPMIVRLLDRIEKWFDEHGAEVERVLVRAFTAVGEVLGVVGDLISGATKGLEWMASAWDANATGAQKLFAAVMWLPEMIVKVADKLGGIKGVLEFLIGGVVLLAAKWDSLRPGVDAVEDAFVAAAHAIGDAFEWMAEKISNLPIVKQVLWAVNKIAEITGAKQAVESGVGGMRKLAGKAFGGSGATGGKPKLDPVLSAMLGTGQNKTALGWGELLLTMRQGIAQQALQGVLPGAQHHTTISHAHGAPVTNNVTNNYHVRSTDPKAAADEIARNNRHAMQALAPGAT